MKLDQKRAGLHPYSGHRVTRLARIGETYVERTHDSDVEGQRSYAYNSLGFRGPEYVPGRRFTVFTFGESDAFGTGLELEQTWPSLVVRRLAEARGLSPDDVCHVNFAESGASNAYIARMVLTQCGAVRPDLVLVNFAPLERTEGIAGGATFPVGPWVRSELADRSVEEAPRRDGLRARLGDQLRRARAFLEFSSPEHGLLESLREMLLVQVYLARLSIPALALHRDPRLFDADAVRSHPILGPLAQQLDARFLFPVGLDAAQLEFGRPRVDAHFGAEVHALLGDLVAEVLLGETSWEEAASRWSRRQVGLQVQRFYEDMPFNDHGSIDEAFASIRHNLVESTYPDLHALLIAHPRSRVLEVGCGTGWLANTLALHYGANVVALDFCNAAITRARALSERLSRECRPRFVEANLFDYASDEPFDLVVSLGVLHHTGDTQAAFRHALALVRPGGRAYLGLYHEPGRRVFLQRLQGVVETHGLYEAGRLYTELDHGRRGNARALDSWFRDQVTHPCETQHTLREVCGWIESTPFRLESTSINRFEPIEDVAELWVEELAYEARARHALEVERRFFPGFFTVMLGHQG